MKFSLLLIILCLCAYASCHQETLWGNTDWNVRELGTETIVVTSSWFEVKQHNFTFPRVSIGSIYFNWVQFRGNNCNQKLNYSMNHLQNGGTVQISGIKHVDYKSHPVNVRFINGGLGFLSVSIEITSQRGHGINSTFTFYAQK